ncbi:MAG TPA: FAD-binding oxidoreductase [Tessaracoccus flavescens]|uniref:FAD-binding oxidoreductase n=1 Tax=Tessaracoccus flavescens TaxID=399497 RepID=A0A921JPM7_9ACTN|nr:FAD-binding oxidoreductase [Tessaracoccus flavescens]
MHDVVVLGATVAGLTVARMVASEGYDVVVLDPNLEGRSAAIGHGVAAPGHASTIVNMANHYGVEPAREHIRRNLASIEEIRQILPSHQPIKLRDLSLPGGDEAETRALLKIYRDEGATADLLISPDGAALLTDAVAVEPAVYAEALRASAVSAGAKVVHGVTVARLTRREGATKVWFRNNLAFAADLGSLSGAAIIDTLGVSPWGRTARVGPAQWVAAVRFTPRKPVRDVTLRADGAAWMLRPIGEGRALVLGQKVSLSGIDRAVDELEQWAANRLGGTDTEPGRLAIDPSDHGRPVVGASAIPGGYYARGNGRGELMNGTASGYYLAHLLMGQEGSANQLPPLNKLRAYGSRLLRRR